MFSRHIDFVEFIVIFVNNKNPKPYIEVIVTPVSWSSEALFENGYNRIETLTITVTNNSYLGEIHTENYSPEVHFTRMTEKNSTEKEKLV